MRIVAEDMLKKDFGVLGRSGSCAKLPEHTRLFAARALSGEYGRAMRHADYSTSSVQPEWAPDQRYAEHVRLIAQNAPLRVEAGEWLAGSSTYLEATHHVLPGSPFQSTSHTTIDFEKALRVGYAGLRQELTARLEGMEEGQGRVFIEAMLSCVDSAMIWHRRNMDELLSLIGTLDGWEKQRAETLYAVLENVPMNPPKNFHEALQALWEFWEFQRLCGNWSGLGRIDKMLGPFLEKDLQDGTITLDQARDMLAHFWIKGSEWIGANELLDSDGKLSYRGASGDAQFYQNIILSGIDEDGRDVTNAVTWLVLDVVEELHISDFPIGVRVNGNTDELLWRRIAELQRLGGGIVSIYNEDLVIRTLCDFGFPLSDARDFTNDGCWEVIIPGKSSFTYIPLDALSIFQDALLGQKDFERFDDLFDSFADGLRQQVNGVVQAVPSPDQAPPTPLISLWVEGCIEKAIGYIIGYYGIGGQKYTLRGIHAGGIPDVANSLLAIKHLVYDKKLVSLAELRQILQRNWEGHEDLRRQVASDVVFYGNDDEHADSMAVRVYDCFVDICRKAPVPDDRVKWLPGISTFGREIAWRNGRTATPFGRHAQEILASNLTPTPGTDFHGPTAVIKSFCKFDFSKLPNGVPLDIKLTPSCVANERGLNTLVSLLKTFVSLDGWYLQVDVVDSEMLKDAQLHPERYPNLSVRVSGWSARFSTLGREWQDAIINRTEHAF